MEWLISFCSLMVMDYLAWLCPTNRSGMNERPIFNGLGVRFPSRRRESLQPNLQAPIADAIDSFTIACISEMRI
jgi:hypothetical protein